MKSAYLVGPFVGELTWEFYRFAPYIITLKKKRPKIKLVVFTRPSRFDLYGQYADILVPLKIPKSKQKGFSIERLTDVTYTKLADKFYNKYYKKFRIINHIYPDISYFYYKLKWQYPRELMDYDFRPRKQNIIFAKKYIKNNKMVFINFNFSEKHQLVENIEKINHFPIFVNMLFEDFSSSDKKDKSLLGCTIEILKRCEFVITRFNTYIARLAMLLKIPILCIDDFPTEDQLKLFNPFNTKVVCCDDIDIGIEFLRKEKTNANNI
ncbi:MAG: hypothetical protein ACFFG0_01250 [Candidatus Thorarchaeota archaeon]